MRFLATLALAAPLMALDQLDVPVVGQWFMPLMDRPSLKVGGAVGIEGEAEAQGQDASLARYGGFLGVSGRVWRDQSTEAWVRATGVDIRVDSDVVLPKTGALPDRLQDLRLGGFWRWVGSDALVGLDAELSSPSDQSWSSWDVMGASATLFSRWSTTGKDGWIASLRYDSTQVFAAGIPLPGLGYQWWRKDWQLTLGFPFLMGRWTFVPDWTVQATWFPVDTSSATLTWAPNKQPWGAPFSLVAGWSLNYESWQRADRPVEDDRLLFRTMRTWAGTEWMPNPGTRLGARFGLIPLRSVAETKSSSDRSDNEVSFDGTWFAAVTVGIGW